MEAPIGYVTLRQAADVLGRAVIGIMWQPLDKLPPDVIAQARPEVERVIRMLAEQCHAGAIEAAYRTVKGTLDRLPVDRWVLPHWHNFFADNQAPVDLHLVNPHTLEEKDEYPIQCQRAVYINKADLDRFVATLKVAKKNNKGGRPREWEWPDYKQLFWEQMETRGDFREPGQISGWDTKAAAAKTMHKLIERRDGKAPDPDQIEKHITAWLKEGKPA